MIFLILIFSLSIYAQQSERLNQKIDYEYYPKDELKTENLISKYIVYDFSTLLTPHSNFLGFIGSDYQRLHIYFTSIAKDSSDPNIYRVKGISLVKNNKCNFTGDIKVEQIKEYKTKYIDVGEEHEKDSIKAVGILTGKYKFKENPNEKHSGIFEGTIILYLYVDRFGILHYDNLRYYSDGYCNNLYIGSWVNYKNKNEKISNWGEYRIPNSGDLDIGAGEFAPDPKYFSHGWEDYNLK